MSLKIRIITPDKIVWNTTTTEVILPSTTGPLGILNDHAPLITALDIGVLRIKTNDSWEPIILLGGFAEINNNIIININIIPIIIVTPFLIPKFTTAFTHWGCWSPALGYLSLIHI